MLYHGSMEELFRSRLNSGILCWGFGNIEGQHWDCDSEDLIPRCSWWEPVPLWTAAAQRRNPVDMKCSHKWNTTRDRGPITSHQWLFSLLMDSCDSYSFNMNMVCEFPLLFMYLKGWYFPGSKERAIYVLSNIIFGMYLPLICII